MTVSEIISRADAIRPNAVPKEVKLGFLSDVEGQVRVLICKDLPEDTTPLTEADMGKVLTAGGPFVRLLCAGYRVVRPRQGGVREGVERLRQVVPADGRRCGSWPRVRFPSLLR